MSETEPRRRRSWTTQEKWRLVEEARLPGNAVAEVPRRRGINNQLFGWMRAADAGKLGPGPASLALLPEASSHNEFIPIGVFGTCDDEGPAITIPALRPPDTNPVGSSAQPKAERSTRTSVLEERPGVIEIDLPNGARVRVDAFVNERALRWVLFGPRGEVVIQIAAGTKVYLACQPVDMRRGFDGLSAEVVNRMNADPYSGHLFLFRGKRGDYLKGLYRDGTGLCHFVKRLEQGKFVWPSLVDGVLHMSAAQLALLVEGMDWRRTLMPECQPKPTMA